MSVRIRLARTTDELDQLFTLRHRIMIDDERYLPPRPDGRLADRFDAYPTTANVIALVDDRIVGAIRFMQRTPAGTSADEYFDFAPFLPAQACAVAAGMLVLEPAYRGTARLVFAMFGMGYHWAMQRGATHVLAPANPRRRTGCLRMGYRVVAPEFRHPSNDLPVVPMILDLAELQDGAVEFLRRHHVEHGLRSSERQFHTAGETVLRRGDRADAVYVIVAGRAAVLDGDGAASAQLGPGDLFGELAVLTGGRRTADVVAATELDLLVIDPAEFRAQVRDDPRAGERVLQLVAERMVCVLER
jgi:N-acyl-L-homoserine lactone synthetase